MFGISYSDPIPDGFFLLGVFLITFTLLSRTIGRVLYLSEPLLATLFGIILGPHALGVLSLLPGGVEDRQSRVLLTWLCRSIIGFEVLSVGSSLPSGYLRHLPELRAMTMLMLPIMFAGLGLSSLIIKLLLPTLSIPEAMMFGGALTPTDPVLASSVVKGAFAERYVPEQIRNLLVAESALNDGFGTPFVYLPLCFIIHHNEAGSSLRDFSLRILLWNVIFGSLLGFAIGLIISRLLRFSLDLNLINQDNKAIIPLALSLLVIGVGRILDTNELLACFFAGSALTWTSCVSSEEFHSEFSNRFESLLDSLIFMIVGTIIPWDNWKKDSHFTLWRLVLVGLLIMAFRRLPAIVTFYRIIPGVNTLKHAIFFGHFGPIGIGAIYYSLVATEEIEKNQIESETIKEQTMVSLIFFVVLCSVFLHGISTPLIIIANKFWERYHRTNSIEQLTSSNCLDSSISNTITGSPSFDQTVQNSTFKLP